jgi:hypothetical protein
MTKNDFENLKKLIDEEIKKRKRINMLLRESSVKEILELSGVEIEKQDSENFKEILQLILQTYKINRTNNIYVCTDAYRLIDVGYNHPDYEYSNTCINSESAEYKIYSDIESAKSVRAPRERKPDDTKFTIDDFEKSHVVLNPYNESSSEHHNNGYDEVRTEFFENCFTYGQPMALKMVKMKYPRI